MNETIVLWILGGFLTITLALVAALFHAMEVRFEKHEKEIDALRQRSHDLSNFVTKLQTEVELRQ